MPSVFISYAHEEDPAFGEQMLSLADQLRAHGIDAMIDQYVPAPPEGWSRWTEAQLRDADFVLMICTERYYRRVSGLEEPGKGLGVRWEGNLIYNAFYQNEVLNTRFLPVLIEGSDKQYIPDPFKGVAHYTIHQFTFDDTGYEQLYRHLTDQPATVKPDLGTIQSLPPHTRRSSGVQPIWFLPYHRNPHFTGRERELVALHEALSGPGSALLTQAIRGLGGIGKSQCAIEYAYRHRDDYPAVLWLDATSTATLDAGIANIVRELNLPEKDAQDQRQVVDAFQRWLRLHPGWLCILDNADEPETVKGLIPPDVRGSLLVTSRAHHLQQLGIAHEVEMEVMTPEEAETYLLAATNRHDLSSAEQQDLRELTEELGYFPLALAQAAAYLLEMGATFHDYLAAYRKTGLDLLEKFPTYTDPQHAKVRVTWTMNFAQVQTMNTTSADLLYLSAFLAPNAIPFELLTDGREELGDLLAPALATVQENPLTLNELLLPLRRFSLIRLNQKERTYDIHRLVQAVIRDGLSPEAQHTWAERAINALTAIYPDAEFDNWPYCDRLITHAQACTTYIDCYEIESENAACLLNQAGHYLSVCAHFTKAAPLLLRAIAIFDKILGCGHPNTASSLNNLASLYRNQGDYAAAEQLYLRVMTICEEKLGTNTQNYAIILNNLAGLYYDQQIYATAEQLCQRALAIQQRVLGSEHSGIATTLNNLAEIKCNLKKYKESELLQTQALAIRERVLGTEHPDVAISLINLAGLYEDQGDYKSAEPLFKRAVNINERALGFEHPDTAISFNNLALFYCNQGNYSAAEPLLQRALIIYEKVFGTQHHRTAQGLSNLAGLYLEQGNFTRAESMFKRSLVILEKVFGLDHPSTIYVLNCLAVLYQKQGNLTVATQLFQRIMAAHENSKQK